MSSNTTSSTPPSAPSAPNLDAILQPQLTSVVVSHTFLTLLFPLLIALFFFSTPQGRRRPIFILNVLAIALAIAAGVLLDAVAIHTILSPLDPWPPSVNIAIGAIGSFQSMFVDFTLLVRLISVHPLSRIGPRRFVLLTALPILLKIGRLINLIMFIHALVVASQGPLGAEKMAIAWATTPYLKIEWFAQMLDNAYVSITFLWTIRTRGNRTGVTSDIHPNRVTFGQRMRTLSRIALSNFIIPTLFSIVQLIVVYRKVDILVVNEIILVNSMLAVFGVVFATVWAGKVQQREEVASSEGTEEMEDEEKKPRAFAFPGLGTWRAATPPAGVWLDSVGYDKPDEGAGTGTRSSGPEQEKNGGVLTMVHGAHGPADALEGAWMREGKPAPLAPYTHDNLQ